jgi:hypothetical protein
VTQQRPEEFRQLGGAFAVGGDRYERLRPGYPDDAVAFLVETSAPGVVRSTSVPAPASSRPP